jgi:hypothetical protein
MMEIKPDDSDTGDGYLSTIVSFTSKRMGYLAVVGIIGFVTIYFAFPYGEKLFSYEASIDGNTQANKENAESLKTLWSEFSKEREETAKLRLEQQFDEKQMDASPGDARRDEEINDINRRLDRIEDAMIAALKK